MEMGWQQFTMNLCSLEAERVEQVFDRHGAVAITLSDAADNPVLEPRPGETPLWSDTRITGLFDAHANLGPLRKDLLVSFGLDDLPHNFTEELQECVWEREWLKDFRPMQFGERLWVSPHTMPVDDPNAVIVWLDPGLAFGTGTHETTALCLEWLDGLNLVGKRVLDIGCGSGILSIAAVRLGASLAHGIDIDEQAILASNRNADDNGVSGQTAFSTDPAAFSETYDVVLANILAGTLISLSEDISKRIVQGGAVALSGILLHQADEVANAFNKWITLDPVAMKNEWARLSGKRH